MLFKLKDGHLSICVLRVHTAVLDLPGVLVADRNAAANAVRFDELPKGLENLDRDTIFAQYWVHDDRLQFDLHKAQKCAEVLVADQIHPRFLTGAYVSCKESRTRLEAVAPGLPITINRDLFFMGA